MLTTTVAPPANDEANYETVRRNRLRQSVREELQAVRETVFAAYQGYLASAPTLILTPVALTASARKALRGNYRHLASDKCLAHLRDEVLSRASAWRGRCPMCACGRASTIDHFLPKQSYPEFSILGANLVPVCDQCNRLKLEATPAADGTAFLHAYFDVLPDEVYLRAELSSAPLTVRYWTAFSADSQTARRIAFQFERLRLGEYYVIEAVDELASQADLVRGLTPVALRTEADRQAAALLTTFGENHWRTALYRAMTVAADETLAEVAAQ